MYLAAAVAGNVASFCGSAAPSLGASGAVFGVGGALAMYFHRNRWEGERVGGRVGGYGSAASYPSAAPCLALAASCRSLSRSTLHTYFPGVVTTRSAAALAPLLLQGRVRAQERHRAALAVAHAAHQRALRPQQPTHRQLVSRRAGGCLGRPDGHPGWCGAVGCGGWAAFAGAVGCGTACHCGLP